MRGTSNTNARGSAEDRRRRQAWLRQRFDALFGRVYCYWCGRAERVGGGQVPDLWSRRRALHEG